MPWGKDLQSTIDLSSEILLKKSSSLVYLSFIGNQPFVDLNPAQFPWPMKNITITDLFDQLTIGLVDLGNGWWRLYKNNQHLFYRINGDFINGTVLIIKNIDFEVKPNPVKDKFSVEINLTEAAKINLRIIDAYGKEITILVANKIASGKNIFYFQPNLSPGLYLVELEVDGIRKVQKIIISN